MIVVSSGEGDAEDDKEDVSDGKVQDQKVGCGLHCLVEANDRDNKNVTNKSNQNYNREQNGNKNWDNPLQLLNVTNNISRVLIP